MEEVDILIVGAGVVGLAVAAEAGRRFPGRVIVVADSPPTEKGRG